MKNEKEYRALAKRLCIVKDIPQLNLLDKTILDYIVYDDEYWFIEKEIAFIISKASELRRYELMNKIELGRYSEDWINLFMKYIDIFFMQTKNQQKNDYEHVKWHDYLKNEITKFESTQHILREGCKLASELRKIRTSAGIKAYVLKTYSYIDFVEVCLGEDEGLTIDLLEAMNFRKYEVEHYIKTGKESEYWISVFEGYLNSRKWLKYYG